MKNNSVGCFPMNAGPVALGEKERVYQTVAAQLRVTDRYQHTCVSSFAIKGNFTLYLLAFISKEGCAFVQVMQPPSKRSQ